MWGSLLLVCGEEERELGSGWGSSLDDRDDRDSLELLVLCTPSFRSAGRSITHTHVDTHLESHETTS